VTPEEAKQLSKLLFRLIPADGSTIGNKNALGKLREAAKKDLAFEVTEDAYWQVRNELIAQGKIEKGVGYGGTVYRVKDIEAKEPRAAKTKLKEADLYAMVGQYIEKTWVKDNGFDQFVLERTAFQGKKNTGGKWTRPDFALIGLRSFPYIPGKVLELISFEVKPEDDFRIEGVFETAAHSRFSNKSYLLIYTPNDDAAQTEDFQRVERECERFGLGLITFTVPNDWNTYKTIQEADRRLPDPADTNSFIASQISNDSQERVLRMVK